MEIKIYERLESLGYPELSGRDKLLVSVLLKKCLSELKNYCSVPELPKGLEEMAADLVCGEFLMEKKVNGEIPGLDLELCVASLSEGDTSASFDTSVTPEKRLDAVISRLLVLDVDQLNAFRKLRW